MIGREPDLTFIIDMDPTTGHARAKGRNGTEERFEDFGADLQVQMREGFLCTRQGRTGALRGHQWRQDARAVAARVADVARDRLPA